MTPTMGDKVLFTFDKARRDEIHGPDRALETLGQGDTVPATVVAVWGEACVNLRVHPDGPGPDLWETSVPLMVADQGDGSYWHWPTVG